jgi:hypothetical protein
MKKLYVLCLITLASVLMDIAFFHSGTVSAQAPLVGKVNIQEVAIANDGKLNHIYDVSGAVVGFSCTEGRNATCFIATSR